MAKVTKAEKKARQTNKNIKQQKIQKAISDAVIKDIYDNPGKLTNYLTENTLALNCSDEEAAKILLEIRLSSNVGSFAPCRNEEEQINLLGALGTLNSTTESK